MAFSINRRDAGRRNTSLLLSSAIAAILIAPGAAQANCTPSPAQANATTTCTGAENRQLVIAQFGSDIVVEQGATLAAPDASSILITSPVSANNVTRNYSTLLIDGTVNGGTSSAIAMAAAPDSYYVTTSHITVSQTGRIAGPTGIDISGIRYNYYTRPTVILDNSGAIASTTGQYALRTDDSGSGRFESITNHASGTIGAIYGYVGTLTNEGLIDGGTLAAYSDSSERYPTYSNNVGIINSGTMRSAASTGTIVLQGPYGNGNHIKNSGVITNDGNGPAIAHSLYFAIVNGLNGSITSNGTAITGDGYLVLNNDGTITGGGDAIVNRNQMILTNRGTINGDVRGGDRGSTVDNIGGTINGSLLLGAGDDLLIGDAANLDNPLGTITGIVDAGGGIDTLQFRFLEDRTLDTAIALPATIERLSLLAGNGSTLTFSESFASTTGLTLGGGDIGFIDSNNRFILNGRIDATGPALTSDRNTPGSFQFINNGTITAILASLNDFAVTLPSSVTMENNGVITARGGGAVGAITFGTITNNGLIQADGTAVASSWLLTNAGTIRSMQGIGVDISGRAFDIPSTNSGTIEGALAGARLLNGALVNSGTISGGNSGIQIGANSLFENAAGGIVNGGTNAISSYEGSYSYTGGTRITNAGVINGNVDLSGNIADVFIAAAGGIVNGNIHLGGNGDIFATALTNDGPGEFAGLTGRVTGSGRVGLRYLIDEDSSATPLRSGIFSTIGYDLANDASLTLTSASPLDFQIGFAGQGKVDLTADMTGAITEPDYPFQFQDSFLINLYQASIRQDDDGQVLSNAVDLTSNGHISATNAASMYNSTISGAVLVGSGNSFTNAGRITATSAVHNVYDGFAAIQALGGTVINNGIIELDNAVGIGSGGGYDTAVINNGNIVQLAGSDTIGILNARTIDNSGTIWTGGEAILVRAAPAFIRNSGTIRSNGSPAISSDQYYEAAYIANEQGGLIAGGTGQRAISLTGGSIIANAGTIDGDVALSTFMYSGGASTYVNRGGTLNGNLILGSGDDIVVALNDQSGISGQIDAGGGNNIFVRAYDEDMSVDLSAATFLPTGFTKSGVGAYGVNATVTLSHPATYADTLLLLGEGTIVNSVPLIQPDRLDSADFAIQLGDASDPANRYGLGSTLSFINKGAIKGGVRGTARSFDNQGEISAAHDDYYAHPTVALTSAGTPSFSFSNSGAISGVRTPYPSVVVIINQTSGDSFSFDNSGQILGQAEVRSMARQFDFTNSGAISSKHSSLNLTVGQSWFYPGYPVVNAEDVNIDNSGMLNSGLNAFLTARRVAFVNSGTIGGQQDGSAFNLAQYGFLADDPLQDDGIAADQESFSLTNSGTINGETILSSRAQSIAIRNSGTVTSTRSDAYAALRMETGSIGAQSVSIVNDGTLSADASGLSALLLSRDILTPEGATADTMVSLNNQGTIRADRGATFTPLMPSPMPDYGYPDLPDTVHGVVAVGVNAISSGTGRVAITNAAGATISATGATDKMTDGASLYPYSLPVGFKVPDAYKNVGSLAIGVIADHVSIDNAGTIRGLAGGMIAPDTLMELDGIGLAFTNGYMAGAIQTFGSADTVVNRAGGLIVGSIDLGDKDDSIVNFGTIDGDIFLGAGNDSFTHALGATLTGTVDGGEGDDSLIIDIGGGGTLNNALFQRFVNFESQTVSGSGTVTVDGPLAIDTLHLRDAALTIAPGQVLQTAGPIAVTSTGGTNSLVNRGAIAGGLDLRQGSNLLINAGSIAGPVTFGDGDDWLRIESGATFAAGVDGGGGFDTVQLDLAGADTAPTELDLSGFAAFEQLRVQAGTGALSGATSFAAIAVDGGRLIGRVGSTINGNVMVASGATFGSAGTVNGDIAVNGTLAPGASPGTMTVNGNVALGATSNTLFEFTPTISDALVVNGTLAIADGARLTMTGERPLTPGHYTLINASGGISGSFGANITRDNRIMGVLSYSGNSIDLIGMFQLRNGASQQVTATNDYLNALLLNGQATSGILAAFPILVGTDGYASPAMLSTLSPEPYASAMQMGIENGLAIAATLRTTRMAGLTDEAGLYAFGQSYGNWRTFGANGRGLSSANVDGRGFLGGIGYGNSTIGAALFVGRSDSNQHMRSIGTSNSADGMVFGGRLHYAAGGLKAGASLIFDRARADTQRAPLNSGAVRSRYDLHGTTIDGWLGYGLAVGDDWQIGPQIGITHVSVQRGAIRESGSSAFALDITKQDYDATFLTGDIRLEAPGKTGLRPWAAAGVRWRVSGDALRATGAFTGTNTSYSVDGVNRKKAMPHVGAGLNIALSHSLSLFVNGDAEFDDGNSARNVNGGISFAF